MASRSEGSRGEGGGLSVIITCYAEGDLLWRALDSVARQTLKPLEVIVVNDASPDERTNAVCREVEAAGRARVIRHRRNGGLSAARNSGFTAARGEWVVPLDADDTLPDDALRLVADAFSGSDPAPDFVFGDYLKIEAHKGLQERVSCRGLTGEGGRIDPRSIAADLLAGRRWTLLGTSPCRRALWRRLGGYDLRFTNTLQDFDFWIRAMTRGAVGRYVDAVIYNWHRAPRGMNSRPLHVEFYRVLGRNAQFFRTHVPAFDAAHFYNWIFENLLRYKGLRRAVQIGLSHYGRLTPGNRRVLLGLALSVLRPSGR